MSYEKPKLLFDLSKKMFEVNFLILWSMKCKGLKNTFHDLICCQIVDTIDFGKFLILDEMANLAESDTVQYTHALMNLPHENYKVNIINYLTSLELPFTV